MESQLDIDLSPPQTPLKASAITRRNSKMSSIRSSLQTIPIMNKNRNLVETRIRQRKLSFNELEDEEENQTKWQSILNKFSISDMFEEKYQILEKLGEGSNGVVYRCSKRTTGEIFAAKSFKFEDQHVPRLKANFILQKSLNHPSIIRYEALYLDMKKYLGWLVMEYIQWPSLDSVAMNSEDQIRVIMQRLLQGLNYLHKQHIVHRDIKPENILYDPLTQSIKIIDFQISRKCKRRGKLFDMWTITGTPYYRAPQMFSGGYREGVDIWAAGILLCKLVSGYTPFQSIYHSETITNILEEQLSLSHHFDSLSHQISCIAKRMLTRKVSERPSASTLLKDVWFYPITQNLGNYVGSLRFIEEGQRSSILASEENLPTSMRKMDSMRQKSEFRRSQKQLISFEELMSSASSINYIEQKGENYLFIDSNSNNKTASSLSSVSQPVRTRKTLPIL